MSDYVYEAKYSSCAVCGRFVAPVDGPAVMQVCETCLEGGRVDRWEDYFDKRRPADPLRRQPVKSPVTHPGWVP